MTSSGLEYHEDLFTLKGMTDLLEFSEQLIRQIQKHGVMLPQIVKFGSEEIEIYTTIDQNMCRRIKKALQEGQGLDQAIRSAQSHVAEVHRVAHGEKSEQVKDSIEPTELPPELTRKKLFVVTELLEALEITEETFQEILRHTQVQKMTLMIPGKTIEYYREDDYLMLRYIVTLLTEGCPMQTATEVAYDWTMRELW